MTKQNSLSLVFILLLIAALVGAVLLVNKNQETRRGAYFSGSKMYMLSTGEEATVKVGEVVPVQLWVETEKLSGSEDKAKVSSVKTTVCWTGDGIGLATDDEEDSVELNTEALKTLGDATLSGNCLAITGLSVGQDPADLKSGAIKLATVKFKGLKTGEGQISYKSEATTVGGYNPDPGAQDSSVKVNTFNGIGYKVTAGGETAIKWRKGSCNTATGKYACTQATDGTYSSQGECEQASGCEISDNSDWPVLKYRISFDSVVKNARCGNDWPVQLIVLGDGKTEVYNDLRPERVDSGNSLSVYEGEVVLAGFDVKDKVAAFFKGPKHLQMKYGVQNQSSAYNKAGGELSLKTTAESGHTLYDFSAHPMLAGDVFNERTGAAQDGVVNGLDYSLVKEGAETHETVDEGEYLALDLDGNCQLNSKDVDVVKRTLKEKQGQLY